MDKFLAFGRFDVYTCIYGGYNQFIAAKEQVFLYELVSVIQLQRSTSCRIQRERHRDFSCVLIVGNEGS